MIAIRRVKLRHILLGGLLILAVSGGFLWYRRSFPTSDLSLKSDLQSSHQSGHHSLQILPVPDLDDAPPGEALPPPEAHKPALFDGDLFFSARFYRNPIEQPGTDAANSDPAHLYRIHPDGTHLRQLTHGRNEDMYPNISPDGKTIFFARQDPLNDEHVAHIHTIRLCRVSMSGGPVTVLKRMVTKEYVSDCRMSPDGRWVVVQGDKYGDRPAIHAYQLLSGITRKFMNVESYSWSPDGRLYLCSREGKSCILKPDTMHRIPMQVQLFNSLWTDGRTLIGDDEEGEFGNGTVALRFDQRGNKLQGLNLHLNGPQDDENTFKHRDGWYPLPGHSHSLLFQTVRGSRDGTRYGCYRADARTGQCRLIGSGQFVGVSSDGGFVALAYGDWTGPHGAVSSIRLVNLKSGQTQEVLGPVAEIVSGTWQYLASPMPQTPVSALFQATDNGDYVHAKQLLSQGVSANARDSHGETALMRACAAGNVGIVALLLQHGADVHRRTRDGKTALILASGADKEVDETPTAFQVRIITLLFQRGADINATDRQGATALMAAAEKGRTRLVSWLLQHGAKVNAQNSQGTSALMIAALKHYRYTVTALLRAGATVNLRDQDGHSALDYVSQGENDNGPAGTAERIGALLKSLGGKAFRNN